MFLKLNDTFVKMNKVQYFSMIKNSSGNYDFYCQLINFDLIPIDIDFDYENYLEYHHDILFYDDIYCGSNFVHLIDVYINFKNVSGIQIEKNKIVFYFNESFKFVYLDDLSEDDKLSLIDNVQIKLLGL